MGGGVEERWGGEVGGDVGGEGGGERGERWGGEVGGDVGGEGGGGRRGGKRKRGRRQDEEVECVMIQL